jgi:hypothetical protein
LNLTPVITGEWGIRLPEIRGSHGQIWIRPIHAVQRIERFEAKLDADSFGYGDSLREREVHVAEVRSHQTVEVPGVGTPRETGGNGKSRGIEPIASRALQAELLY